jgi:hypothetical protein
MPCPQDTYIGSQDATFVLALVAVRRRRGTRSLNVNYDLVKKRGKIKSITVMHLELCSSLSRSGSVESGW